MVFVGYHAERRVGVRAEQDVLFRQRDELFSVAVHSVADLRAANAPVHAGSFAPAVDACAVLQGLAKAVPGCAVRGEVGKFHSAIGADSEFV